MNAQGVSQGGGQGRGQGRGSCLGAAQGTGLGKALKARGMLDPLKADQQPLQEGQALEETGPEVMGLEAGQANSGRGQGRMRQRRDGSCLKRR